MLQKSHHFVNHLISISVHNQQSESLLEKIPFYMVLKGHIGYFACMRQILIVFLTLCLLVSCRKIKEPELRGIENVKIGRMSLAGSLVTLDIKYFNPNPFNARLKQAEGDAWVDSIYLGHFRVDTLVQIPGRSDFFVPVGLLVDMKYIMQHSLSSFLNKEVLIRVEGTAKAGRNGFYKKIPLKYEGKQDLGKLINNVRF
jgi:LEA14-like dessication related protein